MSDQGDNYGDAWPGNGDSESDISNGLSPHGSEIDSEHETEYQDSPSTSELTYQVNGNSVSHTYQRRARFLRMAYDVFHIETMAEFLKAAKIDDEKELMRKYEDLLVRIDSACSDYARRKHQARLAKKEQHKKFFASIKDVIYESDVSTPSLSDNEPILLSENEIANLSTIARIRYYRSIKMDYHAYLSE